MSRDQQGRHQTDAMVHAVDAQKRRDWKTFNKAMEEIVRIGKNMGSAAETHPDFPPLGSQEGETERGEVLRLSDVIKRSKHRFRPRGRIVVSR